MIARKVLILVMMVILVKSRHIHPGHKHGNHHAVSTEEPPPQDDFENIPMNVNPSRFVPLNNRLFFKNMEPCEEGFTRDYLGICREVWD